MEEVKFKARELKKEVLDGSKALTDVKKSEKTNTEIEEFDFTHSAKFSEKV